MTNNKCDTSNDLYEVIDRLLEYNTKLYEENKEISNNLEYILDDYHKGKMIVGRIVA
jgi:hypothetical protein